MSKTIKSIQLLRFIAASLVAFEHSMLAMFPPGVRYGDSTELYVAIFGGTGVHIFFVISGFIMIYTSFGNGAQNFDRTDFFLRRLIRIYPIYWIYSGLYIMFYIVSVGYKWQTYDIVLSLLILPGYSSLIIGQGWTLSYEMYFYMCFGVFMSFGLLTGLVAMTVFFLSSIAIGLALHSESATFHVVTDFLLMEFLAGAWIAYAFVTGVRLSAMLSNALILLALGIFAASFAFGYYRWPSTLVWGVPSGLLIAGSVFRERCNALPRFLQKCSYLGDSSYSLYLIHFLLIAVILRAFPMLRSNSEYADIAVCLMLTALCIAVAFVLYELIERTVVDSLRQVARAVRKPSATRAAG